MQKLQYLILMSTETLDVQEYTKDDLIIFHTSSKARGGKGWNRPGMDDLVLHDGSLQTIIPEGNPNDVDLWGIAEGPNGLHGRARFVAYTGGLTEGFEGGQDTRTEEQKETLAITVKYYIRRYPNLMVLGFDETHNKKDSLNPGFDTAEWLEEIGIPDKNIYKKIGGRL